MVEPLARAATAVGIDGLFFETHPTPETSPSDGPNMVPLDEFAGLLGRLLKIRETVGKFLADEIRLGVGRIPHDWPAGRRPWGLALGVGRFARAWSAAAGGRRENRLRPPVKKCEARYVFVGQAASAGAALLPAAPVQAAPLQAARSKPLLRKIPGRLTIRWPKRISCRKT